MNSCRGLHQVQQSLRWFIDNFSIIADGVLRFSVSRGSAKR